MGPYITISLSIFGSILFLGGILLWYFNRNKRKIWPNLLGLQSFSVGACLVLKTIFNAPLFFTIGTFLLLETITFLANTHILRASRLSKKDTLIAACYIVSVLCATTFYTVVFNLDASIDWVSQLLLFFAGITSLAIVGLVAEGFAKRKGFIKTLIISLIVFIGLASIMSSIAKTPLRTFVSWTLLLESIFLFAYVIRKACIKSRKQALVGLISLIACLGLLTALIAKSPHDPLFNFLPQEKTQKRISPLMNPGR